MKEKANKTDPRPQAWTTQNEIDAITYMGSDEPRGFPLRTPSVRERRKKLETWIETSFYRKWAGRVNMTRCHNHAMQLKSKL